VVSELMRFGNILKQDYEENDILLTVDVPSTIAAKLLAYQVES
jgi:GTP-binding protein HflX